MPIWISMVILGLLTFVWSFTYAMRYNYRPSHPDYYRVSVIVLLTTLTAVVLIAAGSIGMLWEGTNG